MTRNNLEVNILNMTMMRLVKMLDGEMRQYIFFFFFFFFYGLIFEDHFCFLIFFFFAWKHALEQLRDTAVFCSDHLCILILQIMKKSFKGKI